MDLQSIIIQLAPIAANVLMSIVIPISVKQFAKKKLQDKINEVNSGSEFNKMHKELAEVKEELRKLRGR